MPASFKVLPIDTEHSWRGGENQLYLLLSGLAEAGITNYVACPHDSELSRRLAPMAGVKVVALPLRGGFNPRAAWYLAKLCKKEGISIVDAHSGNGHTLGLAVKSLYSNLKLVVHRRVDNVPSQSWLNRRKYLSTKVDRYIAISGAIATVLSKFGVPATRITTVKSAVPLAHYTKIDRTEARRELLQAFGLSQDTCLIGNASALSPQKGYDDLLEAASILKQQNLNSHILIAGTGELRDHLERRRAELNLEHHVTFVGFIEGVAEFLSGLDILAVPSINEGLGTIILDGIGAGLAVCASEVGGIPEIIKHNQTGLLSPPHRPEELAKNLRLLIERPDMRQRYAAEALRFIREQFSVESMVQGNLAVYLQLLES